jgi:hypothetical protein
VADERKALVNRILRYLADHAIALAAFMLAVLALAGGSYAAFTTSGGSVRVWAVVAPNGRLVAGAGHPRVSTVGLPGQYEIDWGAAVSRHCATNATVDDISSKPTESVSGSSFVAGYASAGTYALHRKIRRTVIETFNGSGQPTPLGFDVVVVC